MCFLWRHLGPKPRDIPHMLTTIGVKSLEMLISKSVPAHIRLKNQLEVEKGLSECNALDKLHTMMDRNNVMRSFIGTGFYDCITPNVITRNVLENPAWLTSYTPYQAEIAQGRLECLFTFQTMVTELTGMEMCNSSLLDESTAAAEALNMIYAEKRTRKKFFVDKRVHPQTIAVVKTRGDGIGVNVIVGDYQTFQMDETYAGVLLQYPATDGTVLEYSGISKRIHSNGGLVACAADLLSLTLLKPPGEWGADITVGSTQRLGVPLGFGGPAAGFLATHKHFVRRMPGRIVGKGIDIHNNPAYRMAMQTREQHIRRDKATSNICTSQALLANVSALYCMYHGPDGLRTIANRCHILATTLLSGLVRLGATDVSGSFFDTVCVALPDQITADNVLDHGYKLGVNGRAIDRTHVCYSCDETTTMTDVHTIWTAFSNTTGVPLSYAMTATFDESHLQSRIAQDLQRTSTFMQQPIFNDHQSETQMMRYIFKMATRDFSLVNGMIPLGSCTMKLNATSEMTPLSWKNVNGLHPFAPATQTLGYREFLDDFERILCRITGFAAMSFMPNSGAMGEYTGLRVIRKYQAEHGESHRNICFIPTSAHGTNPASAVLCGMQIVPIKCTNGYVDMIDFRDKITQYNDTISTFMITYPSTFGIFEETISEMCDAIHHVGGQVYMDGANMNAQLGICNPKEIGADVCHLNLHKTFCIPHGGGGPGAGPIGVAEHLIPYLPTHPHITSGETQSFGTVAASPWGSASILPISWMYCVMMGTRGLEMSSSIAILNANYILARLRGHYTILCTNDNMLCAHEFILDLRKYKSHGITEVDVAKRLIDYNFHAPTMSWPVSGTVMIEPTESEDLGEIDRFCDAMIAIHRELDDIVTGRTSAQESALKHAPHTTEVLLGDEWNRPYTRETAAFPVDSLRHSKLWPSVSRLQDAHGDRNLVCTWSTEHIETEKKE